MYSHILTYKSYDTSDNKYEIVATGYDTNLKRSIYVIQGYKIPYLYTCSTIEVYQYDESKDEDFPYTLHTIVSPTHKFYNSFKNVLSDYYESMELDISIKEKLSSHYYTTSPDTLFEIRFKSTSDFRSFNSNNEFKIEIEDKDLLLKFKLHCHNDSISPEYKFMVERNLKYMCWCRIDDTNIKKSGNISYISYDDVYEVDDIDELDNKYIIPYKVAAFDIEVHNMVGNRIVKGNDILFNKSGFPDPNITTDRTDPLNGNGITHISLVVKKYKSNKSNIYNFTCVDTDTVSTIPITKHNGDSIDIPEYKMVVCKDERTLLHKFFKYLKKLSPDFIFGHNSFSFDIRYIHERLKYYEDINDFFYTNSYITSRTMTNYGWNSSAYRNINIFRPNTDVINWCDTLVISVKDFPSLTSYSLEGLCNKFLKDMGKLDMSYDKMFEIFEKYRMLIQFLLLVSNDKVKLHQQVIDSLQQLHTSIKKWNKTIADYCVIDSVTLLELISKWNLFENLTQTCRLDNIAPERCYERGTVIRNYNSIYRECLPDMYINKLHVAEQYRKGSNIRYKGSHVFEPQTKMKKYVATLDFSSLYPSIIIAYNLCSTTIIRPEDYEKFKRDEYHSFEIELSYFTDSTKKNVVTYTKEVRVVKPHVRQGIMPQVLKRKLYGRKKVKVEMSKVMDRIKSGTASVYDKLLYVVLNSLQLAYKVSTNAAYGSYGTNDEKDEEVLENNKSIVSLKFKDLAAVITMLGQRLIKQTSNFVEEDGYNTFYGDTDSVMLDKEEHESYSTQEEFNKIVIDYTDICSRLNQYFVDQGTPDLKLDLEDISLMMNTCSKKGYIKICYELNKKKLPDGWLIDTRIKKDSDGFIDTSQFKIAGLLSKRRDNTEWSRDVFNRLTSISMTNQSLTETYTHLYNMLQDLYNNKISIDKLYKTIKLKSKSEYTNTSDMLSFITNLESRGNDITKLTSDRIRIIYVDNGRDKKIDRMYLYEEYDENKMKLDYNYYIQQPIVAIDKVLLTTVSNDIQNFISIAQRHYRRKAIKELRGSPRFIKCINKLMKSKDFIYKDSKSRYNKVKFSEGTKTYNIEVINKYIRYYKVLERTEDNRMKIMSNIFLFIKPRYPQMFEYIHNKLYKN